MADNEPICTLCKTVSFTTPEWFAHAGQEHREEFLIGLIVKLKEELLEYRQLSDPLNPVGRDRVLNQEREIQLLRLAMDESARDILRLKENLALARVPAPATNAVSPGATGNLKLAQDFDHE